MRSRILRHPRPHGAEGMCESLASNVTGVGVDCPRASSHLRMPAKRPIRSHRSRVAANRCHGFGHCRIRRPWQFSVGTVQTWIAADGSGRQVTTADLNSHFLTLADKTAWAGEVGELKSLLADPTSPVRSPSKVANIPSPVSAVMDHCPRYCSTTVRATAS
jgi:hypothetical protein